MENSPPGNKLGGVTSVEKEGRASRGWATLGHSLCCRDRVAWRRGLCRLACAILFLREVSLRLFALERRPTICNTP